MEVQRDGDGKLEEILKQSRMEGSSVQVEVMHMVPEFVVHERMSQGEDGKYTREKKTVKGWSTEEMKDKANSLLEVDTEEMRKWRGMSQEEMDQCWKNFGETMRLKSWTSTRSRTVKERLLKAEAPRWSGDGCAKARNTE